MKEMTEFFHSPVQWLGICLMLMNLMTFAIYGADKWKARHGRWRISEKTLLLLAVLGGSLGALLGMYVFHHKTRHWYFRWGVPILLFLQAALFLLCAYKLG